MLEPIIGPKIKPIPLVASSIWIADSSLCLSGKISETNEYDEVFKMAEAIPWINLRTSDTPTTSV